MAPDGCGSSGGARRDRTDDLMLAKHALSQLSYGPFQRTARGKLAPAAMVGLGRLERPTSPLSGVRSNHLSYRPEHGRTGAASGAPDHALSGEERETKTAASRIQGLTGPLVLRVPIPSAQDGRPVKEHP